MYSESDLEAAVTAGALTPQQAASFRDYVASNRHMPAVRRGAFPAVDRFNDIFVSIAAVILLVAVGWIGYYVGPRIDSDGPTPFIGLFVAAVAWGLAEFFTRQRRMALPSILLLLAFVGGIFAFSVVTMVTGIGADRFEDGNESLGALVIAAAAAIAAGAAWFHWRRFKVPITVAAGVAALSALVLGLILSAVGETPSTEKIVLVAALVLGVGVFLLAMRWDGSDPTRETRRSDVAFWLHTARRADDRPPGLHPARP
jgi:MFS family permease